MLWNVYRYLGPNSREFLGKVRGKYSSEAILSAYRRWKITTAPDQRSIFVRLVSRDPYRKGGGE